MIMDCLKEAERDPSFGKFMASWKRNHEAIQNCQGFNYNNMNVFYRPGQEIITPNPRPLPNDSNLYDPPQRIQVLNAVNGDPIYYYRAKKQEKAWRCNQANCVSMSSDAKVQRSNQVFVFVDSTIPEYIC